MESLRIYNTLAREKQNFVPLQAGVVRMYVCGMTVYDYCHIGHARVMVVFDIAQRWLRTLGYKVTYVRNITDIDDKIIRRAVENGETIKSLTDRFIAALHEDADALGIERPDLEPRATEYIPQMLGMIEKLEANGYAYQASDGDVNYAVRKFSGYGKLSGKSLEDLRAGERVAANDAKQDPLDFVLWKQAKPEEPADTGWDSKYGRGRPGWHIECSAMGCTLLGDHFDIHGGGQDLQFPHHENEIAQSEAATGKPFVRYWLHAEHLLVEGEKMSKSLGNFFTLRDLFAKGYKPSALRFALASVPYRRQLNFTFDGLQQATSSVERLRNFAARLKNEKFPAGKQKAMSERIAKAADDFDAGLSDDLNTAQALAAIFDFVREANIAMDKVEFRQGEVKAAQDFLAMFDKVFAVLEDNDGEKLKALGYGGDSAGPDDAEIEKLVAARQAARQKRDFAESDRIRKLLAERGIILEDTKDGSVRWKRK